MSLLSIDGQRIVLLHVDAGKEIEIDSGDLDIVSEVPNSLELRVGSQILAIDSSCKVVALPPVAYFFGGAHLKSTGSRGNYKIILPTSVGYSTRELFEELVYFEWVTSKPVPATSLTAPALPSRTPSNKSLASGLNSSGYSSSTGGNTPAGNASSSSLASQSATIASAPLSTQNTGTSLRRLPPPLMPERGYLKSSQPTDATNSDAKTTGSPLYGDLKSSNDSMYSDTKVGSLAHTLSKTDILNSSEKSSLNSGNTTLIDTLEPPLPPGQLLIYDQEQGMLVGAVNAGQLKMESQNDDTVVFSQGDELSFQDMELGAAPELPAGAITSAYARTYQDKPLYVPTPNPDNSRIISVADSISKNLTSGTEFLARRMYSGADAFVKTTDKYETPKQFSERTKKNVGKGHNATHKAAELSLRAINTFGEYVSKAGEKLSDTSVKVANDKGAGNPIPEGAPRKAVNQAKNLLGSSFIALSAISEAMGKSSRKLMDTTADSTAIIVGHRWGPEAEGLSRQVTGSFTNIALVYIDTRGVTRRAVIKNFGKSAVKARMSDGREIVINEKKEKHPDMIEEEDLFDDIDADAPEVPLETKKRV